MRPPAEVIRTHVVPVLLVLSLALLAAQVSYRLRDANLLIMYDADMAVLRGQAIIPEFQNRVLGPLMLTFMRDVLPAGLTNKTVWHLMRIVQAAIGFVVLYSVAFRLSGRRVSAVGIVALITYAHLWTGMTSIEELTSDFLDIMFMSLFVALSLAERPILLMLCVIVASANRESGLFAAVIWASVAGLRYGFHPHNWKRFLSAVIVFLIGSATVAAIRYGLAPDMKMRQFIGAIYTIGVWRKALTMSGGIPMLVATVLAFYLALRALPRPWTNDQKGLFVAAMACLAITLVFGIWFELRVYMPSWTILSLVLALGLKDMPEGTWLARLLPDRRA